MRTELPVLSFLCVAFIILLSPLHWKSRNVAVLSIIIWLFVGSLIQGINSVIWLGNATVRFPVWCDIATKLQLGSHVSIAAACACICQHLYFLSANPNTKQRQHRTLVECSICIILPLLYMALHTIVQNHRFDLSTNFGCTSSTYISTPAIILVWLSPLLLCSITLIYASLALILYFGRSVKLSDGSRIPLRVVNWTLLRPLVTAVLISLFVLASTIFSLYAYVHSAGGLRSWSSWSQVHANLGDVFMVGSRLDLKRVEVEWWVIPSSTFVFFTMTVVGLISGAKDEGMFGFSTVRRWYNTRILGRTVDIESFVHSSDGIPSSIALKHSPTRSTTLSGWGDTLRFTKESEKPKPKLAQIDCDLPPSPSASDTESDASFIVSTLNYIQSPTGRKALGLPSLITDIEIPQVEEPDMPPATPNRLSVIDPSLNQLSQSPASPSISILSASWPEPPSTLPISPVNLSPVPISSPPSSVRHHTSPRRNDRPSSLTSSMASSTASASAYMHDASFVPGPHETRPFEDSGVPTQAIPPSPKMIRKMRSKDSFATKALHRPLGRGRRENGLEEGVYMTVVQETV